MEARDEHQTAQLAEAVLALSSLALDFARVERVVFHQDGERLETDSDHTVMLGLVACSLANVIRPNLDIGAVAQFALVHDLVEAYAGDTNSLSLSSEQRDEKEVREASALQRLHKEFDDTFPWIAATIEAYERLDTPEARFIKLLDKLMPKITHALNGGAFLHKRQITKDELFALYQAQPEQMSAYSFDQPELMELREALCSLMFERCYGED